MILEKYQGCGNDFLIVDGSRTPVIDPQQVAALCDRHRGFGADGLIIARRDPLSMELWNQDGTRAGMCGNGLRCFVHHAYRKGWIRADRPYRIGRIAERVDLFNRAVYLSGGSGHSGF